MAIKVYPSGQKLDSQISVNNSDQILTSIQSDYNPLFITAK
jgi:hypothetical protein